VLAEKMFKILASKFCTSQSKVAAQSGRITTPVPTSRTIRQTNQSPKMPLHTCIMEMQQLQIHGECLAIARN